MLSIPLAYECFIDMYPDAQRLSVEFGVGRGSAFWEFGDFVCMPTLDLLCEKWQVLRLCIACFVVT